ncbi:MAG TPA: TetR family transcriptional regulator [Myxococcota bacterium]|jgi:AcrR family transcriptional regulator|nr:TetR family transcriptional regulator [Myxococcota bacterium]
MAQTPRTVPAPLPGAPADGAPVARLAASQLRRMRAIVDAAVAQAEKGGFEGVRLRDVAEASDVALGTLYKYFRSKEDILLFALQEEAEKLEAALAGRPARGATAAERLADFFQRATRGFTRRPNLARAVVRAIAAGEHELAVKVAGYHLRMERMIVKALRGGAAAAEPTARESAVASTLNRVWFASLVGWAGGLHSVREVTDRMRETAELLEPA